MEHYVVFSQVDDVDGNPHAHGVYPPARNDPEAPALRESRGRLADQADETRPVGLGDREAGGKVLAARAVERVAGWSGLRHRVPQITFHHRGHREARSRKISREVFESSVTFCVLSGYLP